jgi:hypothetical protein
MIQITLPQQIRVESEGHMADSSAMTKEAIVAPADDEYRLAPAEDHTSFEDELPGLVAPPIVTTDNWTPASAITPPMPTQEWSSSNAARTRQMLIVGFLGLGGVLVAGLLFIGFQRWYTGTKKADQNNQLAQAPDAPNNARITDPQLEPLDVPVPPTNTAGNEGTAQPMPAEVLPTEVTPVKPNEEPLGPTSALPTEPNKEEATSTNNATQASPDDPPAEQPATAELPKQLESFSKILERSFEPSMVPEGVEKQKPPPTLEELGIPSAAESKAVPPVEIDRQLELRIAGLVLPDTLPLSNAVNLWVQLSGIPTIVDLDSLSAVGFEFKPIAFKLNESSTVEQLRAAYAEKLKVRFEQPDPSMPFYAMYASHDEMKEKLPAIIKVDDLVADEEQQQWLLKTLDQLFPLQSGKWKLGEGNLEPDPMIDAPTWLWTLRMLESWRNAAKKPSVLSDGDAKAGIKLATQFVNPSEFERTDQPLMLSIKEPAPTSQLLSQICSSAGVQGWVDWVSVGANGLGPSSSDMLVTQGRSARQCLRVLSEKYGLVIAIENEKAVWITTPTAYRQQVRLYVLPSQGKTAEQWQDELQPLTPIGPDGVQAVQSILTPDKDFVIVRCCRPKL